MKILIVDDSNTYRYVLAKTLRDLGYCDILNAGSAEEAQPIILNDAPDIVLLDWNLPKMSGLDFLKQLRSDPLTVKLPVIMVTTVNQKSNVLEALRVGVQEYLFKPVQREILAAKIAKIAEQKN